MSRFSPFRTIHRLEGKAFEVNEDCMIDDKQGRHVSIRNPIRQDYSEETVDYFLFNCIIISKEKQKWWQTKIIFPLFVQQMILSMKVVT